MIFEGTVEDIDLKSPLLEASAGDVVPASLDEITPVLQVSLSVSQWYRGAQPSRIKVETGLGGGDCGFPFQKGKQYLVYAYKDRSGRFSTGICTATALAEDSQINLAYLRGDSVLPDNSRRPPAKSGTGLCTRIVKTQGTTQEDIDDRVSLFLPGRKSPVPFEELERDDKGNFCATDIVSGDYQLAFTEMEGDSPVSFLYYPGVVDSSQATTIPLRSGHSSPDIVFEIPFQPTFSVTGAVIISGGDSHLPAEVNVMLINADGTVLTLVYSQAVAADGTFSFAKVLPGRYWAFAGLDTDSADSGKTKWWTRKTEIMVDGNVSSLSLALTRN